MRRSGYQATRARARMSYSERRAAFASIGNPLKVKLTRPRHLDSARGEGVALGNSKLLTPSSAISTASSPLPPSPSSQRFFFLDDGVHLS